MNGKIIEVYTSIIILIHLWVKLPDGTLARLGHSATAITLSPGLVDVVVFGGTTEDFVSDKPRSYYSRISETTIITFGESAEIFT